MFTSVLGKIAAFLAVIEGWIFMEIGRRMNARSKAKS